MKVAVIGLGKFGHSLAVSLAEKGVEVIAIDKQESRVNLVKNSVSLAVTMNSESEDSLRSVGVDRADVAVVCIGENDFRSAVLTTVLLKKIGVKIVISRAFETIDHEILKNIGADKVVFPEVEMGQKLAGALAMPSVIDYINLDNDDKFSLAQIEAPKKFWGKTIGELQVSARYRVNIIMIKRQAKEISRDGSVYLKEWVNYVPRAEDVIYEGDILWVIGKVDDVQNVSRL